MEGEAGGGGAWNCGEWVDCSARGQRRREDTVRTGQDRALCRPRPRVRGRRCSSCKVITPHHAATGGVQIHVHIVYVLYLYLYHVALCSLASAVPHVNVYMPRTTSGAETDGTAIEDTVVARLCERT